MVVISSLSSLHCAPAMRLPPLPLTALRLGLGFQDRDARSQPHRVPGSASRECLGCRGEHTRYDVKYCNHAGGSSLVPQNASAPSAHVCPSMKEAH